MTESDTVLHAVTERFPEWEASIRRRFEKDAEFQEVCLDYAEACRALDYWGAISEESVEQVGEQYRDLLRELEAEILEVLQEGGDRSEKGL
jgi:hypothetical protein